MGICFAVRYNDGPAVVFITAAPPIVLDIKHKGGYIICCGQVQSVPKHMYASPHHFLAHKPPAKITTGPDFRVGHISIADKRRFGTDHLKYGSDSAIFPPPTNGT